MLLRRFPFLAVLALAGLCAGPALAIDDQGNGQLVALATLASSMLDEARRLEDLQAIGHLQRAYGYYIDKGYWNEAADLFSSSGTLEVGVDGVYLGQDRVREMLLRYGNGNPSTGPGLPFGLMNRHLQLQSVITLGADGRTARARWRNLSLLGMYMKGAWWGDSILENTYRKENGVWEIQSLHLYPNFVAPYHGGWATLQAPAEDWRSPVSLANPPDGPPTTGYLPFPAQYKVPFHYPAPGQREVRDSWVLRVAGLKEGSGEYAQLREGLLVQAQELDRLAAEGDIENLQAMFGYYLDKGLWDEASALFSADASYEFGQGGVYLGQPRIRAALGLMGPQGLEPGMLNNYLMLQPVISVAEDSRSARARWRSDVQLSRGGKGVRGGGVYENEYVNEGGVWKISKLHYYVSYWAAYDQAWPESALPMEGPSQVLPPDLPPSAVYAAQPAAYLPPLHYPHPVTGKPHAGSASGDRP